MPKFTVDLPDALLPGLQAVVERYNANSGADLTVAAWLDLHVREVAVQDQLAAEETRLQQQAQADLQAALVATRDRLIGRQTKGAPE